MKVLLISPSPEWACTAVNKLSQRGYDTTAIDGIENAVRAIASQDYGIVLLQWHESSDQLPAFCRRLRQAPNAAKGILLVQGSQQIPDELPLIIEAGADDYFGPVDDLEVLCARVAVWQHRLRVPQETESCDKEKEGEVKDLPTSLLAWQRDLTNSLSRGYDEATAISYLLDKTMEIDGIDCGAVHLFDEEKQTLNLAAVRGVSDDIENQIRHFPAGSPPVRSAMSGETLYLKIGDNPFDEAGSFRREKILSTATVPIIHENRLVATLGLGSHTHGGMPESARQAIEAAAAHIGEVLGRIKTEEALRQSENRLHCVLENMPVLLYAHDHEGNFAFINKEFERVLGYKPEDVIGNPDADKSLFPDALHLEWIESEVKRRGEYREFEVETTCKDGTKKTLAYSNISQRFPVPGWRSWAVGVDVTKRKRAEQSLRESEERLRNVIETMPEMLVIVDRTGSITFVNRDFPTTPAGEVLGTEAIRFVVPADRPAFEESVQRVFGTQQPCQVQARGVSGRWYDVRMVPMFKSGGGPVERVMILATDITAEKETADRLTESEQRYRVIAENVFDMIWTVRYERPLVLEEIDKETPESLRQLVDMATVSYVSPSVKRLLGYTPEEIIGKRALNLLTPESANLLKDRFTEADVVGLGSLADADAAYVLELQHVTKNGARPWCEVTYSFLRDENGHVRGELGITRDITERREAAVKVAREQQLLRQMLDMHERDRQLIAYEIHDGFSQELSAALFNLQAFHEMHTGMSHWLLNLGWSLAEG